MTLKIKKILLWFFIGLLALGQFQRIELGGNLNGINIYFHDIFILLWLLSFVFTHIFQGTIFTSFISFTKNLKIANFKSEIILMIMIIANTAINLVQDNDYISVLYLARLVSYILFAISLKSLIIHKQLKTTDLRFKFFGAGIIILLLGFLQLIFIQDTRFLAILGWDDHYRRLISTIFDPGFTGIILLISYFYSLTLNCVKNNKIIKFIITLSLLGGIALTFSRATYLALIISVIMLELIKKFWLKRKTNLKETLFVIIVFIVIVIFIPKPGGEGVNLVRTSSIEARKSAIQYQMSKLKLKTFLIGNGLFSKQNSLENIKISDQNRDLIPSHSRIPDNLFLNLLLSTGIFGTGLIIFISTKWILVILKTDQELGAAIIATIIHSQFSNSLLHPFVLLLLLGGIASLKTKKIKV